jgi:nucleoside-diphosphate-sugar epimerase
VNVYYPSPITILDLAQIVQRAVMKLTNNAIQPRIEIIDTGQKPLFREDDKNRIKVNIKKAIDFLGLSRLKSPEESIEEIVKKRLMNIYARS